MLAARWQPFADSWLDLNRFQDEMNRVFERFGYGGRAGRFAATYPALDLWQDEKNYYVEAELPGMDIADIEIFVSEDNQLSLKGSRKPPEIEGAAWHRRERGFGEFTRVLTLPGAVDSGAVQAAMRDGILSITLPKAQAVQPRRIEVKVG